MFVGGDVISTRDAFLSKKKSLAIWLANFRE